MYDRIRKKLGKVAADKLHCNSVLFDSRAKFVSFTFDDFPQSAIDNGAGILDEYGLKGTFYAAFGLAGEENIPDVDCMLDLALGGHEIGCHTFSHLSCADASRTDLDIDCLKNRAAAAKKNISLKSFAYPFGEYRPEAKKLLRTYYSSLRTVEEGINREAFDLASLKAVPIFSGTGDAYKKPLDYVNQLNNINGGWLIFYTHGVSERPGKYDCSVNGFRGVVDAVRQMTDFEVMPVGEVLKKMAISK